MFKTSVNARPHCPLTPLFCRTRANIRTNLILPETRVPLPSCRPPFACSLRPPPPSLLLLLHPLTGFFRFLLLLLLLISFLSFFFPCPIPFRPLHLCSGYFYFSPFSHFSCGTRGIPTGDPRSRPSLRRTPALPLPPLLLPFAYHPPLRSFVHIQPPLCLRRFRSCVRFIYIHFMLVRSSSSSSSFTFTSTSPPSYRRSVLSPVAGPLSQPSVTLPSFRLNSPSHFCLWMSLSSMIADSTASAEQRQHFAALDRSLHQQLARNPIIFPDAATAPASVISSFRWSFHDMGPSG